MSAVRCVVLTLLVGQNSLYTLLRRLYAQGPLKETVSSSALLMAGEVLKFVVSAALVESGELPSVAVQPLGCSLLRRRAQAVARALRHSLPMAVPAVTYAIMNIISYKALELIDATVFAMCAQLKTVATALFAWPVLGRRQSCPQWRAILVLTLAVTIITYQRGTSTASHGPNVDFSATFLAGVGMTLLEVSLSGWIGTYFEKYLKDGTFSVWGRNLQLSFWSIIIYVGVQAARGATQGAGAAGLAQVPPTGHPIGATLVGLLSPLCAALVLLGGGGGLLVALAIKYADSVVKAMAVAFALVAVVAGEVAFMGAPADPVVALASCVAVLGLQIYGDAPKATHTPGLQLEAKAPPRSPTAAVVVEQSPASVSSRPTARSPLEQRHHEDFLNVQEVEPLVLGRS